MVMIEGLGRKSMKGGLLLTLPLVLLKIRRREAKLLAEGGGKMRRVVVSDLEGYFGNRSSVMSKELACSLELKDTNKLPG